MICSPFELGISGDHGGILVLPSDLPVGGDVATLLGLDDIVLDIEIEPNRPDLMSMLGVARETSAMLARAPRSRYADGAARRRSVEEGAWTNTRD